MKDAKFSLSRTLPNAAASNQTATLDLNVEVPYDTKFRKAFLVVTVPALADHTDTSKTNTITLQDSADNSAFADTSPAIVCKVVGVASTGSAAKTFQVPLPPGVRRYVQFTQTVPSGGGTGSNAAVTYDLVV